MANHGTSTRIVISGESLTVLHGLVISPIENSELYARPPEMATDKQGNPNGEPSEAMNAYVNKFRDFAFQKITRPDYGLDTSIARITGIPANEPDYISDVHFIGIMRAIDDMLQHRYKGTIQGGFDNTSPVNDNPPANA